MIDERGDAWVIDFDNSRLAEDDRPLTELDKRGKFEMVAQILNG